MSQVKLDNETVLFMVDAVRRNSYQQGFNDAMNVVFGGLDSFKKEMIDKIYNLEKQTQNADDIARGKK